MELPPDLRRSGDKDDTGTGLEPNPAETPETTAAGYANPIVTAWRLRQSRRRTNRWRLWLMPAVIAAALLLRPLVIGQFPTVPADFPLQLTVALWTIVLPLAAGWLLFGLFDACQAALELLAQHSARSGRAPMDEMLGLTALSDSEILIAGLRLTLPALIPRAIAAAVAVWATLTATNWVWGLQSYTLYGGSYWWHGGGATTYLESYYWDVIRRLLVGAPLTVVRIAVNSFLACVFIVLAMVCAGRLSLAAQRRGFIASVMTLAQLLWPTLVLMLLYVPELPRGVALAMALLPPAIITVTLVAVWLALINGSSPGNSFSIWLGMALTALAAIGLFSLMLAYGGSEFGRYLLVLPANQVWALSGLAVLNPCSLPPEAYTCFVEGSYNSYGFGPGETYPYLLGFGPWLILVGMQLGLVGVGLAFAREAVARWRQGGEPSL